MAVTDDDKAEANRWLRWSDYCQSKRGIDSALSELVALLGCGDAGGGA